MTSQEGVAYNGHFCCTCVFNQFGDVERCVPRPGVHSAARLASGAAASYRDISEAPQFPR
jgi:hypothetical protein